MSELESDKLHAYLCEKAKRNESVTIGDIVAAFGVEEGAAGKRLSLLAGRCVLRSIPGTSAFDCSKVPSLSSRAFASAGSQGKSNTAYFEGLLDEIARLSKNNEALRERLKRAHDRLASLGIDPRSA